MSRHIVFAALMACAAACSRDVTAPESAQMLTGPVVRTDTLRGTIQPNGDQADTAVVLITDDGAAVTLLGPVADLLRDAGSAELWVSGQFTAADAMLVQAYAFRGGDQPDCPTPIVRVIPDVGGCQGGAILNTMRSAGQARYSRKR